MSQPENELAVLIAKWRKRSVTNSYRYMYAEMSLRECADELERALASRAPATTPTPECKECKEWKDTLEMYQNAWMREIGGFIVRKSHPIDGFVLRTRAALKEQYEKGKQDARDGWTGRDKWIEEVGKALGAPAQAAAPGGKEPLGEQFDTVDDYLEGRASHPLQDKPPSAPEDGGRAT